MDLSQDWGTIVRIYVRLFPRDTLCTAYVSVKRHPSVCCHMQVIVVVHDAV